MARKSDELTKIQKPNSKTAMEKTLHKNYWTIHIVTQKMSRSPTVTNRRHPLPSSNSLKCSHSPPWSFLAPRWTLFTLVCCLLLSPSRTFNLDTKMPVVKSVTSDFPGSYFGFSIAFSNETNDVYVGAPKAMQKNKGELDMK